MTFRIDQDQLHFTELLAIQSNEDILLSGGDARLTINKQTAVNKYGCSSHPDDTVMAFGSSTASTISQRSYKAASTLHQRLLRQDKSHSEGDTYRQETSRLRQELHALCGLTAQHKVSSLFAASGTDIHLICAQLMAPAAGNTLRIIMMDACETGNGVAPALQGRHFSDNTALGVNVGAFEPLALSHKIEVNSIKLRLDDGVKRSIQSIDLEVNALIQDAITHHQHVLVIMIDVSKTGLIAPSPGLINSLRKNYAEQVDVLVDACQFRLTNTTLQAYLELGCLVALTGSKFLTGPSFSGILLIPDHLHPLLSQKKIPPILASYSAKGDWPATWQATKQLTVEANWGLLFRLEAALAELRALHTLSNAQIMFFLDKFYNAMHHALQESPHFQFIAESQLDRSALFLASNPRSEPTWDHIPTIFPFILQHKPGHPLTREQTHTIYTQLSAVSEYDQATAHLRCQLGQPVLCGVQNGIEVSALRMCASSRLIVEACEHGATSSRKVIQNALNVLEKTAYLIKELSQKR